MRENIGLFKAKRKDNCEWVEGLPIRSHIGFSSIIDTIQYAFGGYITTHKIDPETLCECSGLRDDNKQLIFEHDKLKDNKGQVGTVFYANGRYAVNWCGVDGEYFVDTCFYGKVIGNKFEEVENV